LGIAVLCFCRWFWSRLPEERECLGSGGGGLSSSFVGGLLIGMLSVQGSALVEGEKSVRWRVWTGVLEFVFFCVKSGEGVL
jgi:hypothetical protein